jgi:hypothetical protein
VAAGADAQITELAVDDHACLTFGEEEELLDLTAAFVHDGLAAGLKVVWLRGPAPHPAASELNLVPVLERREFAVPVPSDRASGTVAGKPGRRVRDVTTLDPADPVDRQLITVNDLSARMISRHSFGNYVTVVEQPWAGDPAELWSTAKRMLDAGLSREVVPSRHRVTRFSRHLQPLLPVTPDTILRWHRDIVRCRRAPGLCAAGPAGRRPFDPDQCSLRRQTRAGAAVRSRER